MRLDTRWCSMAMAKCPECSESVSSSAKTCSRCGAASSNGHMGTGLKVALWGIGVIVLAIVIFVVAGISVGKHAESQRESAVSSDLMSLGLTMTSYNVFEYNQSRATGMFYTWGSADWKDASGNTGTMAFAIEQDGQSGAITAHAVDSKNAALARKYDAIYTVGCNWRQ